MPRLKKEIRLLNKRNGLIERFDAVTPISNEMTIKAEQMRFFLLCDMLNEKGIEAAEKYLEIVEQYGTKKVGAA